ncbi:MAG: hypothetical protein V1703_04115 [Candidatus Altiarchaeota archaeon]
MVYSTLSSEEATRLRLEFKRSIAAREQRLPPVMAIEESRVFGEGPFVRGVPIKSIESTLNRVWGVDTRELKVKEVDELWRPDKPEVALIDTNAGPRVLKTEKPATGQDGTLKEGQSQMFYAELGLNVVRIGVGGMEHRKHD